MGTIGLCNHKEKSYIRFYYCKKISHFLHEPGHKISKREDRLSTTLFYTWFITGNDLYGKYKKKRFTTIFTFTHVKGEFTVIRSTMSTFMT